MLFAGVWCILGSMETKVVKVDAVKPDAAKIKETAELVERGGLVGFPTETVYGIACKVKKDSIAKLDKIKQRKQDKPYSLHIGQKNNVKKYVPTIGLRAEKLIKNGWPGPLTIVFELDAKDINKQRNSLEKEVFEILYKDNSIGIRCPDNPVASVLLQSVTSAVVAPSANIGDGRPAINAEDVLTQFSGEIEMVLDGGPCKYKKSSTVVKIGKKGLEVLRAGVYSEIELEAMSEVKFLFVCTGNTCRSPMAEGMFRKELAEKLECEVDELEKRGYKIFSAGTMGAVGLPASAESIAACAAKGIDIKNHKSRALTEQLIKESDFIFVMEQWHCETAAALGGASSSKCVLLAEDKEIADPIGQPQQVYNNCAEWIEKAVKKRISELII